MKIFTLLLILILIFIINIGLYLTNDMYKSFLKGFKNDEVSSIVNDEYIIEKENIEGKPDNTFETDLNEKVNLDGIDFQEREGKIITIKENVKKNKPLEMSEYEKELLFIFREYKMTKLSPQSDFMGLTYEYPNDNGNNYFEYFSPEVTLIVFSNNSYEEVRETLQVIGDLENFTLNEVDNFGEESFYINLDEKFEDGNIRIVFTNKGKSFGLKISKNQYNNVKKILNDL